MSFIHQAKINDVNYDIIGSCYYGTSSTAAGTAAKVATVSNADGFVLVPGVQVAIKFTTSNSASSPTLNVNSTGAKTIKYRGAAITSSAYYWAANQVVTFVYDGEAWQTTDYLKNPNSDTKATTTLSDDKNGSYPVILKYTTTATDSPTTHLSYSYGVTVNPSVGSLTTKTLTAENGIFDTVTAGSGIFDDIEAGFIGTNEIAVASADSLQNISISPQSLDVKGSSLEEKVSISSSGIEIVNSSGNASALYTDTGAGRGAWLAQGTTIYHPGVSGTIALTSDIPTIPTSLKSPGTLTIQSKGTNVATYDGSGNITANIPWTDINVSQKGLSTNGEFPLLLRGDAAGTTDITKTTSFRAKTTLNPSSGIITTTSGTSVGTYGPSDITLTDSSGTVSIGGHDDKILLSGYGLTLASGATNELSLTADADGLKVPKDVYANGKKYAAGTAVTLNGTSKAGSTASFYAPTDPGTKDYILVSDESGVPVWAAASTLKTGSVPQRYSLTATAGQTSFSIPFDYDSTASNITVYHNGILLKDTDNYTIDTTNNTINLVDYSAEAGDIITVMGLVGVAGVDIGDDVAQGLVDIENALAAAQTAVSSAQTTAVNAVNSAKTTATSAVSSAQTTAVNAVNSAKTTAVDEINAIKTDITTNSASFMKINATNTMGASGKITMNSAYAPSGNYDLTTKTYVDNRKAFHVGTSAPSNTNLLWIDTSTGNGVLTYHNGSAWTRTSSVWA